jgi:hypothetical protein
MALAGVGLLSGCSVVLRHRRLLRTRVLVEAPAKRAGVGKPVECLLEPLASPIEIEVSATGSAKVTSLPKRSELVLVVDTVGPLPRIERKLRQIRHQPT